MVTTTLDKNTKQTSNTAGAEQGLTPLKSRLVDTYDRKAGEYDSDRSVNAAADFYFDMSYRAIGELIGRTDAQTLHVDMPVGTGRFFFYLRDRGWRHRMVGIDISRGMLGVCREAAKRRGDRIELTIGDAFRLPLDSNSVDILTGLRLFHLFPNDLWPSVLAEMRRVLRPGGVLITEMRNAIRGKACRLLVKAFRDRRITHPHSYVAPHRAGWLFRDWTDVTMRGVGLDGLHKVYLAAPAVGRRLNALQACWPVRYLSKTLLVKAHKPEG
jgi:ubiquinone/menaquinone biosynthesis C-methylase UbiE